MDILSFFSATVDQEVDGVAVITDGRFKCRRLPISCQLHASQPELGDDLILSSWMSSSKEESSGSNMFRDVLFSLSVSLLQESPATDSNAGGSAETAVNSCQ